MKLFQKINVSVLCFGLIVLTAFTGWSGIHKQHRHGLGGPHPGGNNHPFMVPARYNGHRHGVHTHEVVRSTNSPSVLEETEADYTPRERKEYKGHKHGLHSHEVK